MCPLSLHSCHCYLVMLIHSVRRKELLLETLDPINSLTFSSKRGSLSMIAVGEVVQGNTDWTCLMFQQSLPQSLLPKRWRMKKYRQNQSCQNYMKCISQREHTFSQKEDKILDRCEGKKVKAKKKKVIHHNYGQNILVVIHRTILLKFQATLIKYIRSNKSEGCWSLISFLL